MNGIANLVERDVVNFQRIEPAPAHVDPASYCTKGQRPFSRTCSVAMSGWRQSRHSYASHFGSAPRADSFSGGRHVSKVPKADIR